jgi:glutathionyl-hydroquinone reductase
LILSALNHDRIIHLDENFDEFSACPNSDFQPNEERATIEVSKLKTQVFPKSKGMMATSFKTKHMVQKREINLFVDAGGGEENLDEIPCPS